MPDNFGETLGKAAKEKYEASREQDERFNREQRLKDNLCPEFLDAIKQHLREQIKGFNAAFGIPDAIRIQNEVADSFGISANLSRSTNRAVRVNYEKASHRIFWSTSSSSPTEQSHQFELRLVGDSHVVAVEHSAKDEKQPWEISEEILRYLGQ